MDLGSLSAHGRSTTATAWATNPVRRLVWWLVAPYFRGAGVQISAEIEASRAQAEQRLAQEETRVGDLARTTLASQLGGLRKDISAIASRLGGLDEEVAAAGQARADLAEWIAKVNTQVQNDSADLVVIRPAVQLLTERLDAMVRGSPLLAGDRIAIGKSGLVIVESAEGTRLLVRQQDHIGRVIADGQEWEPHVRAAIERAARPDATAIDVGAYIGTHTLVMARCFRTVHAFEPQRGIYQMLCGNLTLNDCRNVIPHNTALYDRAGSVRLAPQERQETPTPTQDGQPDYEHISNAAALTFDFLAEGGEVPAIALDDMALENVGLIKVDAQGADLRVLRGAEATIRRCRPTVLFEWERDLDRQHGTSLDEFFSFFAALNYEVTLIHDTTPGRQGDYLAEPR